MSNLCTSRREPLWRYRSSFAKRTAVATAISFKRFRSIENYCDEFPVSVMARVGMTQCRSIRKCRPLIRQMLTPTDWATNPKKGLGSLFYWVKSWNLAPTKIPALGLTLADGNEVEPICRSHGPPGGFRDQVKGYARDKRGSPLS